MKKPKSTSAISVHRIEGTGCKVTFSFQFDPEEFGEARTADVWNAFAALVSSVLIYPAERKKFLAQLKLAGEKAGLQVAADAEPQRAHEPVVPLSEKLRKAPTIKEKHPA